MTEMVTSEKVAAETAGAPAVAIPQGCLPALVPGSSGQIGSAFMALLGERAVACDRDRLDLMDTQGIQPVLNRLKPKSILNAAAYTAVDRAESEQEAANRINASAVRELAAYAFAHDIPFVHFSTDYVFDGEGELPWCENDAASPLNAYGKSKLAGEQAIVEEARKAKSGGLNPRWLIFRTSWVYDHERRNFVTAILGKAKEQEKLTVVNDQFGAPCYAPDLAKFALIALTRACAMGSFPSGIYHMTNSGYTSWFSFSISLVKGAIRRGVKLKVREIEPVATRMYQTPAKRPRNSRLDGAKLTKTFDLMLPPWEDALERCLDEYAAK